jgi:hypothetical protein
MPRGGPESLSKERKPAARPKRASTTSRKAPTRHVDDQALKLREGGATYSVIARRLKLEKSTDAHQAFIRAVRARQGDERQQLVATEGARLDQLEARVKARHGDDPETLARRLQAVENLRAALP